MAEHNSPNASPEPNKPRANGTVMWLLQPHVWGPVLLGVVIGFAVGEWHYCVLHNSRQLPYPPASKNDVFDRFVSSAEAAESATGLMLEPQANERIRDFIRGGVVKLERGATLDSGSLAKAELHLAMFIGAMAAEAKSRNLSTLDERSFDQVRHSFCPLWPFCD